jgi:hypothetical protein
MKPKANRMVPPKRRKKGKEECAAEENRYKEREESK